MDLNKCNLNKVKLAWGCRGRRLIKLSPTVRVSGVSKGWDAVGTVPGDKLDRSHLIFEYGKPRVGIPHKSP